MIKNPNMGFPGLDKHGKGFQKPPTKHGLSRKKSNPKFKVFKKKLPRRNVETEIIKALEDRYAGIDSTAVKRFIDLPLSSQTLKGLKESGYLAPTEIQKNSVGLSLQGCDILGAAKTGSGKTLAFIIPILELLYRSQWTGLDGLGALVITPTRELAYQIFETLRNVGRHHDFSAGLIIGGKDLHFEKARLDGCNIIICTPGRLLHHMDENPLFTCDNLKILVLDEADRCLDMGFEAAMNAILENLPPRQTLLFSATQTKSVRDLARLSLKDPKYISVHENEPHATPERLRQSYVVCNLEDKVNTLWSFIRNHLKHKVLVFLSSCKQVKYMYEAFCRLRPNISLLALYGSLHQMRRMKIYDEFKRKNNVVLFATDLAARGLDFPAVNWVVQVDCPETSTEYIHRVGRTARYHKGGESILLLLPSEKHMLHHLAEKKIPIDEIQINTNKLQSIQRKLEALLARDPELKATAQRSFVSYAKSVFLMRDKAVFQIDKLDFAVYARSLGLAIPPRIRFLQKHNKQLNNNKNKSKNASDEEEEDPNKSDEENESDMSEGEEENKQKYADRFRDVYDFHAGGSDEEEGRQEDLFSIKRADHALEDEGVPVHPEPERKKKPVTKAAVAKKMMKKKIAPGKKTVFDAQGEIIADPHKERLTDAAREYDAADLGGIDLAQAKVMLKEEDKAVDKKLFQAKVKAKHKEERIKAKLDKEGNKDRKELGDEDMRESDSDGPDLSWLPDPDRIYTNSKDEEDSGSETTTVLGRKRKTCKSNLAAARKKSRTTSLDSDDEVLNTGLSLGEDEELALQLLRRR